MLVLIDNYDSFTFNLVQLFGELGREPVVFRNDEKRVDEILALKPEAVILSPGPCDPDQAGVCLDMVAAALTHRLPLLGVCLGHQTIGQAMGGRVVRAPQPMHGKISGIHHTGAGLFSGLPDPLAVARYHSLVVERSSLPSCLEATAWSEDGQIMALSHRDAPIHGVQFHPESIATEHGAAMMRNFLSMAGMA